jgi:prepilin-type processing-associated H-X9-DG protein
MVAYASDFRDCIPPVGTTYNYWEGTRGATWHQIIGKAGYYGAMENYTGTIQGFALSNTRFRPLECPGEKGSLKPALKGFTYYNNEHAMSSYVMHWGVSGYHYYFGYMDASYPMWQYFRRGMLDGSPWENKRASEALLVMDTPDWGLTWLLPYFAWDLDSPSSYPGFYDYAFRHPGQSANGMYRDGHVASIHHFVETSKPLWEYLWKRCPNWGWQACSPSDVWVN